MIGREHDLSPTRRVEALAISRGSAYCQSQPLSQVILVLMRLIDKLHLDHPYAGIRMLRALLKQRHIRIGMAGKGRWRDNVFVERLCRTVKCEAVRLRAYDSVS